VSIAVPLSSQAEATRSSTVGNDTERLGGRARAGRSASADGVDDLRDPQDRRRSRTGFVDQFSLTSTARRGRSALGFDQALRVQVLRAPSRCR